MSSPAQLKAGIAQTTLAFTNLQANGEAISGALSSQMATQFPSSVDWQVAMDGWQTPTAAAYADATSLAGLTNTFVAALTTALNGTTESARFDPLWNSMRSVVLTPLTSEAAFASFLATTTFYASNYDAAAVAAGSTDKPPEQIGLDAYPALVQACIKGAEFLKAYKDGLAEDIAAVMLWAGRDVVTANSEEGMPNVLRQFKETGNTDCAIAATMLTQWGASGPQRERQ